MTGDIPVTAFSAVAARAEAAFVRQVVNLDKCCFQRTETCFHCSRDWGPHSALTGPGLEVAASGCIGAFGQGQAVPHRLPVWPVAEGQVAGVSQSGAFSVSDQPPIWSGSFEALT